MRLYYGDGFQVLNYENADVLTPPAEVQSKPDFEDVRRKIEKFIEYSDEPLVIVNDSQRHTPTPHVLDLFPTLDLNYIVATGTHRAPDREGLKYIFGKHLDRIKPDNIYIHDSQAYAEHTDYGTSTRGTDILIDDRVAEAEDIIIIGSIEPHYFAGYTGGRKGILPGVSAYSTVEHNHSFALDPNAMVLKLNGNPVHEDMEEGARVVLKDKNSLGVMSVVDRERSIKAIAAGDLFESFYSLIPAVNQMYTGEITHKYDIVIAVAAPPVDASFYQAHKAIENAKVALKHGGVFIIVAPCDEGIGESVFYELLKEAETPADVEFEVMERGYRLGYHKSVKLAQLVSENSLFVVSNMAPEIVKDMFARGYRNVNDALKDALELTGKYAEVLVVEDATGMVPRLSQQ